VAGQELPTIAPVADDRARAIYNISNAWRGRETVAQWFDYENHLAKLQNKTESHGNTI